MSVGVVNRNCVVVELGGRPDGADARSQIAGLDQQIMGLLRQQLQKRDGGTGGGAHDAMTAQSAAGALGSYMSQNGISTVDPNRLYQLAMNPPSGTPEDVSKAAKFMLANPDVFRQLETHDVAGADGISGVANFQWAAQGGLDSSSAAQSGDTGSTANAELGGKAESSGGADAAGGDAQINDAPMTAQSAAGALGSYMSQNGISTVDPDKLYQLAMNPSSGTPEDVSKAAKFMLDHPDIFRKLETHDVAGADGISGVGNFQWAAQGGLDSDSAAPTDGTGSAEKVGLRGDAQGEAAPMTAQSAAGALGSYMSQNGISTVDPNRLYQLAMNPPSGTPEDVSKAAKFMLANPDVFRQLETHDVAGADGISGVANFQWAAQGGLDSSSAAQSGDTGSTANAELGGKAESSGGADAAGGDAQINDAPMTAQSAAGALGSYMSQNGISTVDPNRLYQLAMNPPSGTPEDVSKAAKFMLADPDVFRQLETHDAAGADGISGVANFQWAAQGGLDSFATADAKPTAGATSAGASSVAAGPTLTAGAKAEAGAQSDGLQGAIAAMNGVVESAMKAQAAASTISVPDSTDSASNADA
ncbi:Uncharacterised protein [Burkholderia pseudomallei]|nr:Uncharacterised protein [Burkholderia pseudomallei]